MFGARSKSYLITFNLPFSFLKSSSYLFLDLFPSTLNAMMKSSQKTCVVRNYVVSENTIFTDLESSMMAAPSLFLVLLFIFRICRGQWIQHSQPVIPRPVHRHAAGYYDGSIYLVFVVLMFMCSTIRMIQINHIHNSLTCLAMDSGGRPEGRQMTEYVIKENKNRFRDRGKRKLPAWIWGFGKFYTQYDATTLYAVTGVISRNREAIFMFNLQTLNLETLSIGIPIDVGYWGCISSSNLHRALYITGGYNYEIGGPLNAVQVLDLDILSWHSNVDSMNYARYQHGCIVDKSHSRLYSMGWVSEIEMIDITNIGNAKWNVLNSVLPANLTQFGVTEVNGLIFIIGGKIWEQNEVQTVYTINMETGKVKVHYDLLPYPVKCMAVIAVNEKIYGFGGSNGTTNIDTWISYIVPTDSPTTLPTDIPSLYPTVNTDTPSAAPSMAPVVAPSAFPTDYPTEVPSFEPTLEPTMGPTMEPTYEPTSGPSFVPTFGPSTEPTNEPTFEPTCAPTDESLFDIASFATTDHLQFNETFPSLTAMANSSVISNAINDETSFILWSICIISVIIVVILIAMCGGIFIMKTKDSDGGIVVTEAKHHQLIVSGSVEKDE